MFQGRTELLQRITGSDLLTELALQGKSPAARGLAPSGLANNTWVFKP